MPVKTYLPKPIKIYNNIFGSEVHVLWGWKSSDYRKYASKLFGVEETMNARRIAESWTHGSQTIVWIGEQRQYEMAGSLAHELMHAVARTLCERGVIIDADNHETPAYCIGYYTDVVLKQVL